MKTKYQIDDKQIAAMDLTISMTMPVSQWRDLMRDLPNRWPACDVSIAISEALGRIATATSQTFQEPTP